MALAVLFTWCLFLAPPAVEAAEPAQPGSLMTRHGLQVPSLELPDLAGKILAMGGREEQTLSPGSAESSGSGLENFFKGSFLGALLFGYPYETVGVADITVVALVAFFLSRIAFLRRKSQSGDDKFTVHRGTGPSSPDEDRPSRFSDQGEEQPRQRVRPSDLKPSDLRPPDTPGGANDPRDNAWSRRLRGDSGRNEGDGREAPPSPWATKYGQEQRPAVTAKDRAAAMWKHLSSEPRQEDMAASSQVSVAPGASIPSGFDVPDFLEGARMLYIRLQKAWAARQVDELAPFTSENMFTLLKKQAEKDPNPVQVDILLVNATLQDVVTVDGDEQASVLFAVTMRSGDAAQPEEISEVWRFARGRDTDGMWRLTGIAPAA